MMSFAKNMSNLIHTSPWYYRITRRLFGVDKLLQNHVTQISKKQDYHALLKMRKIISKLKNYKRFSRWLLGLSNLISGYERIENEGTQEFDEQKINVSLGNKTKTEIGDELVKIRSEKYISEKILKKTLDSSFTIIRDHLKNQQAFLQKNINLPHNEIIPESIGQMGSFYFDAPIYLSVSGGKPLNCENLMAE